MVSSKVDTGLDKNQRQSVQSQVQIDKNAFMNTLQDSQQNPEMAQLRHQTCEVTEYKNNIESLNTSFKQGNTASHSKSILEKTEEQQQDEYKDQSRYSSSSHLKKLDKARNFSHTNKARIQQQ